MSIASSVAFAVAKPKLTSWRGGGTSVWLPSGSLALVLAILIVPPIIFLIYTSVTIAERTGETIFTLDHFRSIIQNKRLYVSAWNSFVFSALATIFSILLGGPLAWVVERTNAPFRPLAYVTVVVSLGSPGILYVAAWQFILGRQGPLNELFQTITGAKALLVEVHSMLGMVLIQGVLWSPLVFLLLSATFRRSNAELEEAARISGASVLATVWRVSFRLALPTIVGMAMFVFIRNLESFDVPILIGFPGDILLLTSDIYLAMSRNPPQMGLASAFSVVLIACLAVLMYYHARFAQSADRYASVTGKGFRPRPFDLGRWRWIGGAIVIGYFTLVFVLPLIVMIWNSLMPYIRPMRWSAVGMLSFDNYGIVFSHSHYMGLAKNTIVAAAAAATITMALTTAAGWLVVRQWPGSRVIEQLVAAPIVFPGIVLGVALVIVALRAPLPLYGTLAVIVMAFVIRYMPFGMRYIHSGVLQIHRELEEAGGAAGASQWEILRRIVVPLLLPAVASGWVFVFLIGANELSMSVLLAGPRSQVMAVAMFELWSNGQSGEVYALGMLWTLFMTSCALIFYLFARKTVGAVSA